SGRHGDRDAWRCRGFRAGYCRSRSPIECCRRNRRRPDRHFHNNCRRTGGSKFEPVNILDFSNILVFRIGHLGDTLVSLPAFWAIRNTYPKAKLTLLSNADESNPGYISARAVLPETGLFDEWITYPPTVSII